MKKVILLGAGYANLALIKKLPKDILNKNEFILISDTPLHYFTVRLHEVASGLYKDEIVLDIESILPKEVKFIQDRVELIQESKITTATAVYDYDVLVVGLGFQSDSFNIKGIQEFSNSIVNYEGALALHAKMLEKIKEHQKTNFENNFNIIVCGAGFTGIEFIGSLVEFLDDFCTQSNIDKTKIKITCVEAMSNILPMFNESLAKLAKSYLEQKNVIFELGSKILECTQDGILVENNGVKRKIDSSFTVWTAGVKGNEVMEKSTFFTSNRSKVEVNEYLQPINQAKQELMENIFVIGDCAAFKDLNTQRFYPSTAQMALSQGEFLASILVEKLEGRTYSKQFVYTPKGTICSVGSKYAIGQVGSIQFSGRIAAWLKKMVESKWKWKLTSKFFC